MSIDKKQLKRFFKILGFIVVPFTVIWIFVVSAYFIMNNNSGNDDDLNIDNSKTSIIDSTDNLNDDNIDDNLEADEPNYIVGAVLGVDKSELLTDVMMVGVYNTENNMVNIFSIPRDTRIELSDSIYNKLNETVHTPKIMKLNELHAKAYQAGVEAPEDYTLSALEQILGIEIDHYVEINTNAFTQIVDSVGGVEIYVPKDMIYHDPYQDLYIHINEGNQVLNGAQAEGFVRYRSGYSNGDLGRIEMQQYFLQAFMDSLLSWGTIPKIPGIINTVYDSINTDMSLMDSLSYVKYVSDIQSSKFNTHMIPGEAMYIDEVSYFVYDSQTVKDYVSEQLNQLPPIISDSRSQNTIILNGSYTDGLASKYNDLLCNDGYNIISIGNYDGDRADMTRIIVSDPSYGNDLMQYFNYAEVIHDPEQLENGIDIKIIIGLSEN